LQRRLDIADAETAAQAAEFCVESVRSALRMSLETPRGLDGSRSSRPQIGASLAHDGVSCRLAS
jgi:hypothetical protein